MVMLDDDGHRLPDGEVGEVCVRGGAKAPNRVQVWDALPRDAAGVVLKKKIRERYWARQDRHI